MSEKCNVPNAFRCTLNKTLTFRQHKSNLSESRRVKQSPPCVRFHRFVLVAICISILVRIPSFHKQSSFFYTLSARSIVCVCVCVSSIRNNECVWKCLIKSNKSLVRFICTVFFSLHFQAMKNVNSAGVNKQFLFFIILPFGVRRGIRGAHGEPV